MMRLVHTKGLQLKNLTFKNPTSYAVQIADCRYFNIENITFDYDLSKPNIDGIFCDNGYTGVRLLSRGDAIRNIHISNIHGEFRFYAVSLTHHYPIREDKPILLENIHLSDIYASKSRAECAENHKSAVLNGALIWLEHGIVCRNVMIENIYRNERNIYTKAPTVRISENVTAENLQIKNIQNTFAGEILTSVENNSERVRVTEVI